MLHRRQLTLLWFFPLAGCLQAGPPPSGTHIFHSQVLESPQFLDDRTIRFNERVSPGSSDQSGVYNLWLTSFDPTDPSKVTFAQRMALANFSSCCGEQTGWWPQSDYPATPTGANGITGEHYFMADEHVVESKNGTARAASLVRLGSTFNEEFRIDDVGLGAYMRFTVPIGVLVDSPPAGTDCPGFPGLHNNCPQLFFERPPAKGQTLPTLMLWDGTGEMPVGLDSGGLSSIQIFGGNAYLLLDDKHVLTRFRRPAGALDSLRENVAGFSVSGDEHYAALSITDGGKSRTVILDLKTGLEISLPNPNPWRWAGFSGNTFFYYMSATPTSSGQIEIHAFNVTTGEEQLSLIPKPLTSIPSSMDRPNSNERLLLDSAGHGVFTNKNDLTAKRVLQGPLVTPSFSPDGSFLIYVDPAAPTTYDTFTKGALMFQNADTAGTAPATMVSIPAQLVGAQYGASYFFIDGDKGKILVFWAHFGRESSGLFFADYYQPGSLPTNLHQVSEQIMYVSISEHSLFGIVNVSQQDDVGDLIYRDLDHNLDKLFAQGVADNTEHTDSSRTTWSAYIVRGRTDSDRSGLWLTTVTPPEIPVDGGTK
jgi:hypothetical protein